MVFFYEMDRGYEGGMIESDDKVREINRLRLRFLKRAGIERSDVKRRLQTKMELDRPEIPSSLSCLSTRFPRPGRYSNGLSLARSDNADFRDG